jgi:bacillithiol biosynthesis deacetylase BshB1
MSDGPFDAMFLTAHPDDAEICCAGTILRLLAAGKRVVLVDMTEGEMGTRGDAQTRRAEAVAATRLLGVQERINLRLPDTGLRVDDACVDPVVEVIRRLRPTLLFAQHPHDVHPDHVATGRIAERAFFVAGLLRYQADLGAPSRPDRLLTFPGNDHVEPSFCVDISAHAARKRQIVECYGSQVGAVDPSHFAKKLDALDRVEARDRYFGALLGVRAAEPFIVHSPLALDPTTLLP